MNHLCLKRPSFITTKIHKHLLLTQLKSTLDEEQSAADRDDKDRRSVGLVNIHRRIKAFYGDSFGLEIESGSESGTTVRLRLPVKQQIIG